jgi:uncharacterized membrane protein YgcG
MPTRSALAAVLIVAAAGCRIGARETEQASLGVPQRDLTLQQAATPDSEVASALEVGRLATIRPRVRPRALPSVQLSRRKPAAAPAITVTSATIIPADSSLTTPGVAASAVLAAPADASSSDSTAETDDPHALAPGSTVTALPTPQPGGAPGGSDGWSDQPATGPTTGGSPGEGHGGKRRGGGGHGGGGGCHGRSR